VSVDPATWARGRGWALWKALITYANYRHVDAARAAASMYVIEQIFAEFAQPT
jgi:aminoglycoside phosphotransferase (APT) family kinase protein